MSSSVLPPDDDLLEFLDRWKRYLALTHRLGKVTQSKHGSIVRRLVEFLGQGVSLAAALHATRDQIAEFLQLPLPPTSTPALALRRFFEFAVADGQLNVAPDIALVKRNRQLQHVSADIEAALGSAPEPSRADVAVMATIADESRYECPAPILLIVGGEPPGQFSISLTVMLRGEAVRLRYGAPPHGFPRR